jgi:hypothetical protein
MQNSALTNYIIYIYICIIEEIQCLKVRGEQSREGCIGTVALTKARFTEEDVRSAEK